MKLDWKQQNTEYLMRDKKRYIRSKFNRDIALQDWSLMYKIIGANDIFHKFIEIFQNVLNSHAPLKNIEVKRTKNGYQKNCVVSLMKSIVYSMIGKKILIKSSLTVTKYLETMLIENCVKHLTIIPNNFLRISQLQKNNGNLSRTKLTQTNRQKKLQS